MNKITRLGLPLSFLSLGVAVCCILPMTFMLFGVGGAWLAVFGKIAGASVAVLTVSAILIGLGWVMALLRGTAWRQKWLLGSATALTGLAWLVYLNETKINMQLIEIM
ncbi:MAG: mercuric ion transport protein [Paracoccaceae bacterium]|jgi:mercuric ion transport protein